MRHSTSARFYAFGPSHCFTLRVINPSRRLAGSLPSSRKIGCSAATVLVGTTFTYSPNLPFRITPAMAQRLKKSLTASLCPPWSCLRRFHRISPTGNRFQIARFSLLRLSSPIGTPRPLRRYGAGAAVGRNDRTACRLGYECRPDHSTSLEESGPIHVDVPLARY